VIKGINHITLSVKDVDQSFEFYTQILGFKPVAKWPKGAYLTHIAFTISEQNFKVMSERIKKSWAKVWQENRTEGDSLYFVDPNGHKLEIHASSLKARIKRAKINPWDGLEFFI
jgi:catechol 2,3-dioxygenase-like lactoylglutathione lyase family enzyme